MGKHAKNAQRLAGLEAEFLRDLTRELEHVERGANTLFFYTEEFNPHALPPHRLSEASATLSVLAVEILALREKLGLPIRHIPAEIFRAHLQRNANIADEHRLGPQRRAAELLQQLRESVSSADI